MPFTLLSLGAILLYIWMAEPRVPGSAVAVPVALVLTAGVWNALRRGDWGCSRRGFWPAVRASATFTAVAIAIVLSAGVALGTVHWRPIVPAEFAALIAWGGAQQWMLQTVVLREAQEATSNRAGRLLAATLFAGVHLPNPLLTVMTFAGALGWCRIYDRHPNMLPLAVSHAVGTLAILSAFDDQLTGRLRVGAAYLEWMRM